METTSVMIVGAGLSGLSAAQRLAEAGLAEDVVVVDKGRGVGGRLATRRIGEATLDYGAQFFTVRSNEFRERVDGWLSAGVVEEWCQGFAIVDGYPRYRTAGGMNELARHLASGLEAAGVDIVTDLRVGSIVATDHGWGVTHGEAARDLDAGAAMIATPPVPQTMALLASGGVELAADTQAALADFTYHRVIALLAVVDRSPGWPDPGAMQQPDDPIFSFVADNQAKGISATPSVTFHTAHQLSAQLWDSTDEEVASALLPPAHQLLGSATVTEYQIKRWHYSGPVQAHPEPCLLVAERPGPLILAGDGFGGSKVEGAFLSGLAAAEAIINR